MIPVLTEQDTQAYMVSTRLIMLEAMRKGYSLTYFPSSRFNEDGIVRAEKGNKEVFFQSTCIATTSALGMRTAENKTLTYSMLVTYGVNTPEIITLSPKDTLESAFSFLERTKKVVVKPVDASHGDGVTVNVEDKDTLESAVKYARATQSATHDTIVQQQVEGKEYRFLVVSGKVIAVTHRRPPFVVGDGTLTVRELLEEKNRDPRRSDDRSTELMVINIDDVAHHKGKEFLDTVPAKDQEVNVLDTSNLSRGGESIDFTDIASPALKKMAVTAAASCFLDIGGVDIITPDVTAETLEDSYVIEVNLTPGIRMHMYPSVGKARDVVSPIFAAIEKTAHPVKGKLKHVGRADVLTFAELGFKDVYSRIDTGARTSAIWVSEAQERDGVLEAVFFAPQSEHYTGERIRFEQFEKTAVSNSTGHTQIRYKVRLLVKLKNKKIRAWFTLADRSTQVYPVLIGRNVLMGKFIVDVKRGRSLKEEEDRRHQQLTALAVEANEERK